MTAVRRLDRWMFAPGSAERLAIVRIGLMSVLAVRLMRGIYVELAGQPSALFRPLSYMALLPGMPPRPLVIAVQIVAVTAALAAAAGVRIGWSIPIAWLGALLLIGMTTSLGKVMHNDVLLVLCIFPLLWARSADAFALGRPRSARPAEAEAYGWPVRTMTLVVVGSYFLAGLAKLEHSGVAWVTSDNLRWVLYTASDAQTSPNGWALFVADRAWLAHLFAAGSLWLEVTFPVVLFKRRLTVFYVLGAVCLHTGIWLAMGLNYFAHSATVVIVLANWPRVVAMLRDARPLGRPLRSQRV